MDERCLGLTLIELLISLVLLSVIILGFSNIEIFSRRHILTTDKREKLQNEVAFILEHMAKNISQAIGNERAMGDGTVLRIKGPDGDFITVSVYIDANKNALLDDGDFWVGYNWGVDYSPQYKYQFRYCGRCDTRSCSDSACKVNVERLADDITEFVFDKMPGGMLRDYADVKITACWDPLQTEAGCGAADNPGFTARTRIRMPSVATQ